MRHRKDELLVDEREGSDRERADLKDIARRQRADALHAHLVDFLELAAAAFGAVDAFAVIELERRALGDARVFDDAERDIGLERHELAAEALECQDGLTAQKPLVVEIQRVFLELAHLVEGVAVLFVEGSELEIGALVLGEGACFNQHCRLPP